LLNIYDPDSNIVTNWTAMDSELLLSGSPPDSTIVYSKVSNVTIHAGTGPQNYTVDLGPLASPVFNFVDSGPPTDGDSLTVEDPIQNDAYLTNTSSSPGAGVISWGNPVTETINYSGIENFTGVPAAAAARPATHFLVTSSAGATIAGTSLNFTVTALDAENEVATAYTGTVQFASADPQAVLPPPYTFTAADQGKHQFSVTLKTVGTQTVTVSGTDLPSGAVSSWRGEGNAQDSVGSNNGTLHGGVTFAPGEVGQAFNFNGSNGYVSVPDAASLNPTQAITVEAWINPHAHVGSSDPIVKKAGEGTVQKGGYGLEFSGNDVVFWLYLSGLGWSHSPMAFVPLDQWSHVAGVYDGHGISLYVDGKLVGTTVVSGTLVASHNPLEIGHDPANADRWFNGEIDEATVYNRGLRAAEIQDIYLLGTAGKFQTIVGSTTVTVVAAPTIVPNLAGLTMNFGTPGGYTNTLAINSVQDQSGATGNFVAAYTESRDGVVTTVSGTMTFKGLAPNPFGLPGFYYDFAVTFSGTTRSNFHFNPRTGIWSYDLSRAGGSGDFYTNAVSANAGIYQQGGVGSLPPGSWFYSGNESDSLTYESSNGSYVLGRESGPVKAYNWYPW
jgi:hypothetical protein